MDLYDTLCKRMIFLILSGMMYTIAILPNLQYIFYTQWGILLLVKIFLVLFVVIVGGLLCYSMKKKKVGSIKRFFKMDMCLMIVILLIVGLFTYLNPLPINKPFYWNEMGSTVHMTTQIIPNTPGKNRFTVQIWMPEMIPKPKNVQLLLTRQK
jgi:copper transport protein